MSKSEIIYLLPGIEGKLHAINASKIYKLSPGERYDLLTIRDRLKWRCLVMPVGTIKRYWGCTNATLS